MKASLTQRTGPEVGSDEKKESKSKSWRRLDGRRWRWGGRHHIDDTRIISSNPPPTRENFFYFFYFCFFSSSSSSSSSFTELWDDCLLSARCFSAVVSGSERPRTGLLSPVSPNQKTGSAPYADWSTTATVNTVIGQSGRVTHGYRLPQQYLRSISPPWLPWPAARYLSLPYVYVTLCYNAVSPAARPLSSSPFTPFTHPPRLAPITSG